MHIPVMVNEVIKYLVYEGGKVYVDGTLGGGGHSIEILKASSPYGILIGIDMDKEALNISRERLKEYRNNVYLFNDNFLNIPDILNNLNIKFADGILLDLGVSSFQLMNSERGFSFRYESFLDMRMNRDMDKSAVNIINEYPKEEIEKILKEYGEERWANKIADLIVKRRVKTSIKTTKELEEIVISAIPPKFRSRRINPATRTFQAIRIAVNDELKNLENSIPKLINILNKRGRFVVITFHSLEDRIVKRKFKDFEKKGKIRTLTKKVQRPSKEEINLNPRARSAKLRAVERI
jgi:16S rRNA (cytosine1402-N4)-methyltransferase